MVKFIVRITQVRWRNDDAGEFIPEFADYPTSFTLEFVRPTDDQIVTVHEMNEIFLKTFGSIPISYIVGQSMMTYL